jgi:branched-chain amino acid transport system ATP-binding protein
LLVRDLDLRVVEVRVPLLESDPREAVRADAEGVTVVMVEQNALAALEPSDRSYVLEQGRVSLTGTGQALLDDPHVRAAYLGA